MRIILSLEHLFIYYNMPSPGICQESNEKNVLPQFAAQTLYESRLLPAAFSGIIASAILFAGFFAVVLNRKRVFFVDKRMQAGNNCKKAEQVTMAHRAREKAQRRKVEKAWKNISFRTISKP
ncbi:MAG: hypothetical protein IKO52_03755 [Clostridia bacterium]|nr:hypothetical protein [Clostridia bacterium]